MRKTKGRISIVIADDHELTRLGIRKILETADDINIIGEAENGDDAIILVGKLHPMVLLLDIRMPGTPSREVEQRVRELYPDIATLILTGHDRDVYLADFLNLGVAGYLDKKCQANNLVSAIYRAVDGEFLFSLDQLERAHLWNIRVGAKWDLLTTREKEVARLLAQGMGDFDIAEKLHITRRTTFFHIDNIVKKLNVETRLQVIAWMNANISDDL